MRIATSTYIAATSHLINVPVNLMGYCGEAINCFRLGTQERFFGPNGNFQEVYLRTESGNIYLIETLFDEFNIVIPGAPVGLTDGRRNADLKNNPPKVYALSMLEGKNLVIELGKALYLEHCNTTVVVEIVLVATRKTYLGSRHLEEITKGRVNSIRKEFYEFLYPGKSDLCKYVLS